MPWSSNTALDSPGGLQTKVVCLNPFNNVCSNTEQSPQQRAPAMKVGVQVTSTMWALADGSASVMGMERAIWEEQKTVPEQGSKRTQRGN